MAGTAAGAAKRKATLIEKLGSEEAYYEYMRANGSKGGVTGDRGGFAQDVELARRAGKMGAKARWEKAKQKAPDDVR